MIRTITEFDFVKSFDDVNRSSNFTIAGRKALFNHFEEMNPDMELDPIAVCCEYTEYASLEEWKQDYVTNHTMKTKMTKMHLTF